MGKKVTKPLGKLSPWVWSVELVRGCNLSCWHCTARIFPEDGRPRFMSKKTWVAMCKVLARETPRTRLELAQGGEPTLHPRLIEFLRIARELTPTTQIQIYTNGLTLMSGKYKFADLFGAGASTVYVDMYAPQEKFVALARESGAEWYLYNNPRVGSPGHRMANTYYGDPTMRLVVLQNNPHDRIRWRKMGRLSTWLNHVDWGVAMPYGLVPVREPYHRKCTLPQRYVSTSYTGGYLFCCIDFWCESDGMLGNVNDGPEGFKKFWFGRLMQTIRRQLRVGDRGNIPFCSRCNCAFAKCDWVNMWPEESLHTWWDGVAMRPMPPARLDGEVFDAAWEVTRALKIPTPKEEAEAIGNSKHLLIRSTAAMDRDRRGTRSVAEKKICVKRVMKGNKVGFDLA